MGGSSFTDHDYSRALKERVKDSASVTAKAEQKAYKTGLLDPQVDPAANGVIRFSKPLFRELENGFFELEIGLPMSVESRLDTTGSMGDNVDIAMKALPKLYNLCTDVLPGYDLQIATGIFGDIQDRFVLCRPKFAHSADRLVERLTLMVPEGKGGDETEDPHYGLFAGAYLTNARINSYNLKGYDFTISDAPSRVDLDSRQLERIFGKEVFEKTAENGFNINKYDLPDIRDIVRDLLKITHAFLILVDPGPGTADFWQRVFGEERVIKLRDISYLPYLQALIIGLTEGTLTMTNADWFLKQNGVTDIQAATLVRSVAHIPIGEQEKLRYALDRPLPQKGDLFRQKSDIWPIEQGEIIESDEQTNKEASKDKKIEWL